jgi:hypothetical protein
VCRNRGSARDRGAALGGCSRGVDEGKRSNGDGSINVAIVDTPNTRDVAHHAVVFTDEIGIKVNYTISTMAPLREVTTSDVAAKGRQFDVVTIGPLRLIATPQRRRSAHGHSECRSPAGRCRARSAR